MPRPLLLLGPALYPPCDCVVFFVCRPSLPPPGPCLGGVAIEGSPLQRGLTTRYFSKLRAISLYSPGATGSHGTDDSGKFKLAQRGKSSGGRSQT